MFLSSKMVPRTERPRKDDRERLYVLLQTHVSEFLDELLADVLCHFCLSD